MSTALFAIPAVLTPLQGLWRWLWPDTPQIRRDSTNVLGHSQQTALHSLTNNCCSTTRPNKSFDRAVQRPLRVVRVLEAGQAPAQVGRMVISGRMADVCAELDRLAAFEAALP